MKTGGSIYFRYDKTFWSKLFNILNFTFLLLVGIATLYPFLYILSVSISRLDAVAARSVVLWPVGFELKSYMHVFSSGLIMRAYLNTIVYSLSGVFLSLFMLVITAYPLSIKSFYGRNFIMILFVITMFFSGGLIPNYLVVRSLGMINTIWALIVPNAIGVFYLVIIRTNFQQLPDSLRESANIDGANHIRILFSIIMPLSVPILATMFLFIIVGNWNSFFRPLIYLRDMAKQPLQVVLRDILVRNQFTTMAEFQDLEWLRENYEPGLQQALRAAAIIVSTGPILMVYPFIQKYFVKGVLIGSIKG
jgi:putative aldouronate transport system permease protein